MSLRGPAFPDKVSEKIFEKLSNHFKQIMMGLEKVRKCT